LAALQGLLPVLLGTLAARQGLLPVPLGET
jgi:hypothetical protein